MSPSRRIFWNVIATYGRSLYALVIGLFCGRWTLLALGETDYGLLGVLGGLVGFVFFFNDLMSQAVGRFYAFAVGKAQRVEATEEGLENCRRWFNVVLLVHTVLPTLLLAVGYPLGLWAIEHYLVIPADRLTACVWGWRFLCLAAWFGMANVPFMAMYTAKQEIAELTIYGFASTTLNALFMYYVITHPGFWLVKLSAWSSALAIVSQLVICVRACLRFPECRLRVDYLWDWTRLKELGIYAGGRFIGIFAQLFSTQGSMIAVNKLLGPIRNAAMTVANVVVIHASTLTDSCSAALYPALTNAAGRGDRSEMCVLAYRACKLSVLSTLVFALPLILEIDEVMRLWLKVPPEGAATLCALILVANVINRLTDGHWMSVFACGRVMAFNVCESVGFFLVLVLAVAFMKMGLDIASVGYGMIAGHVYALVVKVAFARRLCGLSARHWMRWVLLPIMWVSGLALMCGMLSRLMLTPSLLRVVLTTLLVEGALLPLTWYLVLDEGERAFLVGRFRRKTS